MNEQGTTNLDNAVWNIKEFLQDAVNKAKLSEEFNNRKNIWEEAFSKAIDEIKNNK